jgi:hypothetical protein
MMTPAFDEDHHPVPATEFDYDAIDERIAGEAEAVDLELLREEIAVNLLQMLCHKADARLVGQQALVLGFVTHAIDCKTQKELAKRLGIGKARCSRVVNQVRRDFLAIGRHSADAGKLPSHR